MEAHDRNLKAIFEMTRQYHVPLYQRSYVWEEEKQWAPLWQDVRSAAEYRLETKTRPPSHFLGAIVLSQMDVATGEIEARLVIDGQQRLTTMQLLLAAARDVCAYRGFEKLQRAFVKLTENDDPLNEGNEAAYKVVPTNRDRAIFRQVLRAGNPDAIRKTCGVKTPKPLPQRIAAAYEFFYEVIFNWALGEIEQFDDQEAEISLRTLYETLREDLHVVVIDLGKSDDAQVIFESLNARGTPLLAADLVKNYLLFGVKNQFKDDPKAIDKHYDEYWAPFDDEDGFWQEKVKQGRTSRPRIDIFLQHYATMERREEAQVEKLFGTFKKYAEKEPMKPPSEHLSRLALHGKVFRSFTTRAADQRDGLFFRRLEIMEVSTVYPLLLEVFRRLEAADRTDDLVQVMNDLESYLVRRMVCHLTTKNYNRFVADILGTLQGVDDHAVADVIRLALVNTMGDSVKWPDDEEFRRHWMTGEVYENLTKSRVRMLLTALERGLWTKCSDPIALTDGLTIEHIMPVEWKQHWPIVVDEEPESAEEDVVEFHAKIAQGIYQERNGLIHTIGNLTLLTGNLNPVVSNGPWTQKREAFKEHCGYALTRQVCDLEEWNENTIRERGERLFTVALKLWPRPSVTPPTG